MNDRVSGASGRTRKLSIDGLMRDSNQFPIAELEKIDPAFAEPSRCGDRGRESSV
jgi:hypothetical protein